MNLPVDRSRFTQRPVFVFLVWLRPLTAPLRPGPFGGFLATLIPPFRTLGLLIYCLCSIIEHLEGGRKRVVGRRELAKIIARARERAGVSQLEVAERLGLPRSAISKMENGEQRVDSLVLAAMSRLYGVSVSSLLVDSDEVVHDELPAEALLRSAGNVAP